MIFRKKQTTYVSEFDQYLQAFDKSHEPSPSQQAEKAKHDAIATIRDKASDEL